MEIEELINLLRGAPFFADQDTDDIADLLRACKLRSLSPGEALWSVGERGEMAFILVSGRVESTWRNQPDGQRTIQHTEPGTLMSLSALVRPWAYRSAAVPLERTQVLCLSRDAFRTLFDAQHPIAFGLVDAIGESLVDEMRDANRRLHEVFGHPAETLRMLKRRVREEGPARVPRDE